MQMCAACGIPLGDPRLIGLKQEGQLFCLHCINEEQKVRPCDEIFQLGVECLLSVNMDTPREVAEKITRSIMNRLSYWENETSEILDGEELPVEEIASFLSWFEDW